MSYLDPVPEAGDISGDRLRGLTEFLVEHHRCGAGFDVKRPGIGGSGSLSVTCKGCGGRLQSADHADEIDRERGAVTTPAAPAPARTTAGPQAPSRPPQAPPTRPRAPATALPPPAAAPPRQVSPADAPAPEGAAPPAPGGRVRVAPPPQPSPTTAPPPTEPVLRAPPARPPGQPAPLPAAPRDRRLSPAVLAAIAAAAIAAVVVAAALIAGSGSGGSGPGPAAGPPSAAGPGVTTVNTQAYAVRIPVSWRRRTRGGALSLGPAGGRVEVRIFFQRRPGLDRRAMAAKARAFLAEQHPGARVTVEGTRGTAAGTGTSVVARYPSGVEHALVVLRGPLRYLVVRRVDAAASGALGRRALAVERSFRPR